MHLVAKDGRQLDNGLQRSIQSTDYELATSLIALLSSVK